eukprot:g12142.t1
MHAFPLVAALGVVLAGTSSAHAGYIGCYGDDKSDRVLTAQWSSDTMTPEVCARHCQEQSSSYTHYAMQYGSECWCQDDSLHLRHGAGTCDYPCAGDSESSCGGYNAFDLYGLEHDETPAPPTGDNYIGCYADDRHDRVLGAMTSSSDMTPEVCAAYCTNEDSHNMYYATQYSRECWCAVDVDLSRGEGTCDYPCTGDSKVSCGGFDAFDLFELDRGTPTEEYYVGCFADDRHDRVLDDMISTSDMTLELCEGHCSSIDKPFFSLQYGRECWCGGCELLDEGRDKYDRHGTASCVDYPCTGESTRQCGARDAFSLYYRGDCEPGHTPAPTKAPTPAPYTDGTPSPTSTPTPAPAIVDIVCEMALGEAIPVPTALGGSSVTVTASPCEFDPAAIFSIATSEGDVLALIAGELVDASTAAFTLPGLPMDTNVVMVTATSATGQVVVGNIQVFGMDALLEYPSAGVGNADSTERTSVITDPPSDLLLKWDASTISTDSVEIVLVASVTDAEGLEDVAVLGTSPNTGSYVIEAATLGELDPEGSFVLFKIAGIATSSPSSRRLQDSGLSPIVFPEIVTTGLVAWLEDLEGDESSTELCSTAFTDDYSKCQCFFTAEKFKTGRGVQLDAFDGNFRCPANIGCILDAPPGLVTLPSRTYEDLSSSSLSSGWKNDGACPFGSCLFDSAGDDRTVLSCARSGLKAGIFDLFSEVFLQGVDACELHPGAEFCVRTNEATSGGENTGIGNQCCYDNTGNILVDATTGGGTVDRREAEPGGFNAHELEDTLPFNWCCDGGNAVDSWLCQMYIEMRPVDAGDGYVGGDGETPAGCSAAPGGGAVVSKTQTFSVQVPQQAESSVDFGLLVDVSGSYSDDIANLKSLAAELVEGLSTDSAGVDVEDLRLGLGSFSDIPTEDAPDDSPYTLVKPFGNCGGVDGDEDEVSACWQQERDNFISSVNILFTDNGGDAPESQTIALLEAATSWEWRDAALKILAITTDAPFHVPGDGSEFEDQYASLDAVISACNDKNIKILALKSPGSTTDMDTIAFETGGVVETTSSDSSDIVEKILAGIEEVQYKKIDVEWACRDSSFELKSWTHTQSPSSGYENVDGGVELEFTVTVSVPSGVKAGIRCVALVVADEVLIGGQEFVALDDGTISATAIDIP